MDIKVYKSLTFGDLTMFFIRRFTITFIVCLNYVMCADITLEPSIVEYSSGGGDTVSITCLANLTDDEVNIPHWFTWTRNGVIFAENATGMFYNNRYSIAGDSSAQVMEISQTLNILFINETDHGQYNCILNFEPPRLGVYKAEAFLLIKDYLPVPQCNYTTVKGSNMQVTLSCLSQPGNPVIALKLVRNDESFLTSIKQFEYAQLELDYQYNVGDEDSWLNFTCKSSNNQTMNKECHIFLNTEELNWDFITVQTTQEPHLHTNTGDEVKPDEDKPDAVKPDKVYIITFATGFGILFIFIIMLCVYCGYIKKDVNNVNNNMRKRNIGEPSDEWGRCDLSVPQLNNNAAANVYKQHVELEEAKVLSKDVKSESTGLSMEEVRESNCNTGYMESKDIVLNDDHISVDNPVYQSLET